jgi:hypothetical protein
VVPQCGIAVWYRSRPLKLVLAATLLHTVAYQFCCLGRRSSLTGVKAGWTLLSPQSPLVGAGFGIAFMSPCMASMHHVHCAASALLTFVVFNPLC